MKDPRRLLDGDASALERSLLGAALTEDAPLGAEARLLEVLGVSSLASGAAAMHPSVAPPAASSLGEMGSSVAPSALATGFVKTLTGKLVVFGILAGVGTTLLVSGRSQRSPVASEVPARRAQSAAASAANGELVTAPSNPALEVSTPSRSDAHRSVDRETPAPSIAREVAALDAVQALVQNRQAGAALSALDSFDTEHPYAVLTQEARVLRIEALLQSGAAAKARALAERFLHEHAQSPHVARVRSLLRQVSTRP